MQGPEILSIRPDHGRSEAYLAVRCNKPAPGFDTGKDEGNAADGHFFNNLLMNPLIYNNLFHSLSSKSSEFN
jgi:hypothetical protein